LSFPNLLIDFFIFNFQEYNKNFSILDASNDNQISPIAYQQFCVAVGRMEKDAEKAFADLNRNANGDILGDEYLQASKEFHLCDDLNGDGN